MEGLLSNPSIIWEIKRATPDKPWTYGIGEYAAQILHALEQENIALNGSLTPDQEDTVSTPDAVIIFNKEAQAFAEDLKARTTHETLEEEARVKESLKKFFGSSSKFEPVKETDSVVDVLHKVIGELKENRSVLHAQIASLHRELTSLKEAPTIHEEPPAPIWTPWESSTRAVFQDGVTVAVAYDHLQAERFVKEHNDEMERVSKR